MEIGIDSVEIERIKKIYLKEGNKFLERIKRKKNYYFWKKAIVLDYIQNLQVNMQ